MGPDKISEVDLPPHFAEAHDEVCALFEHCRTSGIPDHTVLAAIMTEIMPRLVQAYGAEDVATMLHGLVQEVLSNDAPPTAMQ